MGRGSNPAGAATRPEHLFSCPPNFFESATLYKGGVISKQAREDEIAGGVEKGSGGIVDLSSLSVKEQQDGGEAGVRWTCNGCRASFHSSEEQRSHFKSDYHRLNVKRRVLGKEPINEEEFEAVADGLWGGGNDDLSSISGSDDESDDPEQTTGQVRLLPRAKRIYFGLPDVREILSLWRPVVIGEKEFLEGEKGSIDAKDSGEFCVRDGDLLSRLQSLISSGPETNENFGQKSHVWMILLAAGGHFAGVVVNNMKAGEVLAHHTFHRYVVRAKAGGRQSTQDKSGKAPKSAGASLRRYNEAALQNEIRNLLTTWGDHLRSASHIFVHAPSANSQALFGGENAPLNRNDMRIRRIPFTTRRPTFKEAKRVHHVLAAILYEGESTFSDDLTNRLVDGGKEGEKKGLKSVDTQTRKSKESISRKVLDQPKGSSDVVGSSSANVAELSSSGGEDLDWTPLHCTTIPAYNVQLKLHLLSGRITMLEVFGVVQPKCDSSIVVGTQPGENEPHKEGNLLHQAAKSGNAEQVLKLLEDGLDPCVKDEGGYTPYARAGDKDTRNVFRRFMAGHPDMWDWHAANVPSALTEEMEAAQIAKQAEKDMKRKEREKERKRLKKEELRVKEAEKKAAELAAAAVANVRGTGPSRKASKGPSQSAGFQEALLKAQAEEREMRAAAAELRMRAMMAGKESQTIPDNSGSSSNTSRSCSCCGDSLTSKTPFYRLSYQYCSTTCVQVHRKYLESD